MSGIKRYDPETTRGGFAEPAEFLGMTEDADGEYVLFADHEAKVAAARREEREGCASAIDDKADFYSQRSSLSRTLRSVAAEIRKDG